MASHEARWNEHFRAVADYELALRELEEVKAKFAALGVTANAFGYDVPTSDLQRRWNAVRERMFAAADARERTSKDVSGLPPVASLNARRSARRSLRRPPPKF